MTDVHPSTQVTIAPQRLPADKPETTIKVTGKRKVAIDAMVWEGLHRREAAAKAGLAEHSLYQALRLAPIRAYYLSQCEVLRTSGRARRIHRLEQIAEQDDNKQAAVNAIKALDYQEDSPAAARHMQPVPGLVVQIINQQLGAAGSHMPHIRSNEPKPLIEQESGSHAEGELDQ